MAEEAQAKKIRGSALILEPNEESAGQLRSALEQERFEVVGWNQTGVGWLKTYAKLRPDLVFSDVLLPDRDGIYCINKLVVQDPSAICVFMHQYQGKYANYIEGRALAAGAAAVLQKPIVWSRLKVMLDRFAVLLED